MVSDDLSINVSKPEDSPCETPEMIEDELQNLYDRIKYDLMSVYSRNSVLALYRAVCPLPSERDNLAGFRNVVKDCIKRYEEDRCYARCVRANPYEVLLEIKQFLKPSEYDLVQTLILKLEQRNISSQEEQAKFCFSTSFCDQFSWRILRKSYPYNTAIELYQCAHESQSLMDKIGMKLMARYSPEQVNELHSAVGKLRIDPIRLPQFKKFILKCESRCSDDSAFLRQLIAQPFAVFDTNQFCEERDKQGCADVERALDNLSIGFGLIGNAPSISTANEDYKRFFQSSAFFRQYISNSPAVYPTEDEREEALAYAFRIQGQLNETAYELSKAFSASSAFTLLESVSKIRVRHSLLRSLTIQIESWRDRTERDWLFRCKLYYDPSIILDELVWKFGVKDKELSPVRTNIALLWPWWARIDLPAILLYSVAASSRLWLFPVTSTKMALFLFTAYEVACIECSQGYISWLLSEFPLVIYLILRAGFKCLSVFTLLVPIPILIW